MTDRDSIPLLTTMTALLEGGLETQSEPFPATHIEYAAIQTELRALDPGDLQEKLVIAGFLASPIGPSQMRCRECIYYLIRRKWCDLPEIALPVEPDWWCRLWRI